MLTVRVIKSKWLRGEVLNSGLLISNKMCCIGFVARRLGATASEIQDKGRLEEVKHTACANFRDDHEPLLETAYEINDDPEIKDRTRMTQLRQLGKEMGIKFVFVNK